MEFYEEDYERVFSFMFRLKRGFEDPSREGVYMKDVVYLNGFIAVEDFIERGGSLKDIYIGKIHLDDLALIQKNEFFGSHKKDIVIPFSA